MYSILTNNYIAWPLLLILKIYFKTLLLLKASLYFFPPLFSVSVVVTVQFGNN